MPPFPWSYCFAASAATAAEADQVHAAGILVRAGWLLTIVVSTASLPLQAQWCWDRPDSRRADSADKQHNEVHQCGVLWPGGSVPQAGELPNTRRGCRLLLLLLDAETCRHCLLANFTTSCTGPTAHAARTPAAKLNLLRSCDCCCCCWSGCHCGQRVGGAGGGACAAGCHCVWQLAGLQVWRREAGAARAVLLDEHDHAGEPSAWL